MANVGNVYLGVNGQAVDLYSAKKMYVGFNNKAVEIPLGQSKFDYKTWLASASLSATGYSSLDDVLEDEVAVRKLMTIHASVNYLAGWKTTDEDIIKILSNDICVKWITLRDYALDTLDRVYRTLMESLGKFYYGEWAKLSESPETWGPKGNVPIMTSNTAPYGGASADTTTSGGYPYAPFNGADTPNWRSTSTSGSWIQYKFTNPVCVKRIMCRVKPTSIFQAGKFKLQASNDGSTFVDLLTFDYLTDDNYQTEDIVNSNYYLYYRIATVTANMTNGCTQWNNIQFYGRTLKVSVPVMTSNTAPYGEASASSVYNNLADRQPWQSFKNNNTSASQLWTANTNTDSWIQYKFPQKTVLKKLMLRSSTRCYHFTVRGSDDGNTFEDILTGTCQNSGADATFVDNYFDVPANSGYDYIRIFISDVYSGSYINVQQIYMWGENYSEYDWDADNPRHYLYDHGVEFVTFDTPPRANNVAGPYFYTIDSPTVDSNMYGMWATNATIDLTPYDLMRICIGKELHSDLNSAGNPKQSLTIQVNTAKTAYNSGRIANRVVFAEDGDLAYNEYLDISAVNQSAYPNIIASTDGAKGEITEWWLE